MVFVHALTFLLLISSCFGRWIQEEFVIGAYSEPPEDVHVDNSYKQVLFCFCPVSQILSRSLKHTLIWSLEDSLPTLQQYSSHYCP